MHPYLLIPQTYKTWGPSGPVARTVSGVLLLYSDIYVIAVIHEYCYELNCATDK